MFAEGQVRSLKFYDHFHYYEYKGGVTYASTWAKLTLGAGRYDTYKEGGDFRLPKNNEEFRLWPQLIINQTLGRITLENRYRSEMRFTSSGYRNRFRYRLGASYSLSRSKANQWQILLNNELFFTDRAPYFERNRLQALCIRKLTKAISIQGGYLHQLDYRINDETGRDFLVFGINLSMGKID